MLMGSMKMSRKFVASRVSKCLLAVCVDDPLAPNVWKLYMVSGQTDPFRRSSSAFRKLLAHRSDRHKHYDDEPEIHSEPKPEVDLGGNTLPNVWKLYMVSGRTALFDYLRRHFENYWLIEVIVMSITAMSRRFIVSRGPRWILGETRFQTYGGSIWFLDGAPFRLSSSAFRDFGQHLDHYWLIEVAVMNTRMSRRCIVNRAPRRTLAITRPQTYGNSIVLGRTTSPSIFCQHLGRRR